jgi:hypothetical protein
MGNVDESHSFDVAEALEADLGNLHPEDEALIESVVAVGETTQATQDSQQATAAVANRNNNSHSSSSSSSTKEDKKERLQLCQKEASCHKGSLPQARLHLPW